MNGASRYSGPRNAVSRLVDLLSTPRYLTGLTVGSSRWNEIVSSVCKIDAASILEFCNYRTSSLDRAQSARRSAFGPMMIRSAEVYSKPNEFSLCLFRIPRGCRIPFHNHPNQFAFAKVLQGQLTVRSVDKIQCAKSTGSVDDPKCFQGTVIVDEISEARYTEHTTNECPIFLTPTERNIHEVSCESSQTEDCVFFDLTTPPYDDRDHDITYFTSEAIPSAGGKIKLSPCQITPSLMTMVGVAPSDVFLNA